VPFALVASGVRGLRITAVNAEAFAAGVQPGLALADARAVLPVLVTQTAQIEQDAAALAALARWAGRYGPQRQVDGVDGIWIDTTGVAHLFGGERGMLQDLLRRLAAFGFSARAAIAPTYGAAFALARYAASTRHPAVSVAESPSELEAALAPLPVAALRLDAGAVLLARRLGLKRIGDLYDISRNSLARRFRSEAAPIAALLARLDAALGRIAEPHAGLVEPPQLAVPASFPEPLISAEGILAAVEQLAGMLALRLDASGLGLRRGRVRLHRADGTTARVEIGTSAPVSDAVHIAALVAPRLESVDAGFGVDMIVMEALAVEPLAAAQASLGEAERRSGVLRLQQAVGSSPPALDAGGTGRGDTALARLVDRLSGRLGGECVLCLALASSHIPEHAEDRIALLTRAGTGAAGTGSGAIGRQGSARAAEAAFAPAHGAGARPPLLLSPPEPITVMAEVPDGPPLRFTWRRVDHRVVAAEGPERIAPQWWLMLGEAPAIEETPAARSLGERVTSCPRPRTRDYYRVEDVSGGRYWVFREGLYGRGDEAAPRWFMHGLFG